MDYNLDSLGDRNFEHLVQALSSKFVGQAVSVFGDGGDGGREATWDGPLSSDTRLPKDWDGYGVVQAKFKVKDTSDPSKNADWLIKSLRAELAGWSDPDSARKRVPRFLLFASNVTLSPGNDGGIEKVEQAVQDQIDALGLSIAGFVIWHRDSLRSLLDDAEQIRSRYAAWITPGDLIVELLRQLNDSESELKDAVASYTVKTFRDGSNLNLTQAGSVNDQGLRIDQVFIDLPVAGTSESAASLIIQASDRKRSGQVDSQNVSAHVVLVGGPGQGKSTVTQFLTQYFRANFLAGSPVTDEPEVADLARALSERALARSVPLPAARRWPIRVILTDFADCLSDGSVGNLFDYIASEVSRVSGYEIAAGGIRAFLRIYPWLLLLDGLDEVPATSNRTETIRSVNDFLLDAANLGADVFVVVTTRPQGYGDEFASLKFDRADLAPLPSELALEYVTHLSELRVGAESERFRQISRRLRSASVDPETSRLMSTPLQATILALLVERQGQAPKDRWRLFSQYYRVIYQREQEKGGELSEVLSQYETDIHAVHYAAGFVLQARAEGAGETESVLSSDELDQLLAARLREQGHLHNRAVELASSIRAVTTDRLVFLAALRKDTYGFEIRSLQEFMAGEQIFNAPPERLINSLRSIALSAHWSNVLMFAVGKIFAEREQHRTDVVTLCDLLNSEHRAFEIALPGSVLASRILEEGSSRSTPMFERLLTSCAGRLLHAGPDDEIPRVGRLMSRQGVQIDDLVSRPETGAFAALQLLASEADRSSDAAPALEEFIDTLAGDAALEVQIVRFASSLRSRSLSRTTSTMALRHDPRHAIAGEHIGSSSQRSSREEDLSSDNVYELVRRWIDLDPDDSRVEIVLRSKPELSFGLAKVQHQSDEMEAISSLASVHPGWQIVRAAAEFADRPTNESLQDVEYASKFANDRLVRRVLRSSAWPLAVRQDMHEWSVRTGETDLSESVRQIQRDDLSGATDWLAAETRWSELMASEAVSSVWSTVERFSDDPRGALPGVLNGDYLTPIAASVRVSHDDDGALEESLRWQRENLLRLVAAKSSPVKSALARILVWDLGSRVRRSAFLDTDEPIVSSPIPIDVMLDASKSAAVGSWFDLTWLDAFADELNETDSAIMSDLAAVCRLSGFTVPTSDELRSKLMRAVDADGTLWPLARLVFGMGETVLCINAPSEDEVDPALKSLAAASRLIASDELIPAAEVGSVWSDLTRTDDVGLPLDAVTPWSLLAHPRLLMEAMRPNDERLSNLAELVAYTRQVDALWSTDALARLRKRLESLPSNEFDVPGIHKAMASPDR